MNEMMSGTSMWPFGPLIMLVFAALIIVPFWFIFKKAGYPQWLSLLMVVPIANLAMLYFLAFSDWPRLRERKTK
ncbi:MAG: hypothetical protein PF630_00740 [Gammaproteobacteria bacterium]|jgi:hypothetical protein|nr:hypothetical protein [Gammaproteobacteria bacterium]